MQKIKIGIIGSGNIGTDLLVKSIRSPYLDPVAFVGRRMDSDGIQTAIRLNIPTSIDGIDYFDNNPNVDVVFDCTNATSAIDNWNVFRQHNIRVIDLTPSKIGTLCVPIINGSVFKNSNNVNMITCGGQSSIPILHMISNTCESIEYIEIVSQISSKSAGLATRINIDQYINTTEDAIHKFTNCKKCKVILNLNPAIPCVNMQTTMFIKSNNINFDKLQSDMNTTLQQIKQYVPGYELCLMPVMNENEILILSIKVTGSGDYLPSYAGNLDIINCAAINVAESLRL